MQLPNIYEYKHYKLLIIIPIAMLLVSIYFIPKIQLDQSLKGGVSIQLQTNSTIDTRTLAAGIDSALPGSQASISRSPGGVSVTLASNSTLYQADAYSTAVYASYGNYSNAAYLIAAYKTQLQSQPNNSSLTSALDGAETNQSNALTAMQGNLANELSLLSVFNGGPPAFNSTDAQAMAALSASAYSNASSKYKDKVISVLRSLVNFSSYSYNEVTPTLGLFFLSQIEDIIIWAFVAVAIAVLFIFRNPVPAMAVVFSSANDILVALGVMGIFGIPFGVASIGGILMLIGYSIDTSLLSSIRILKRSEDTAVKRAYTTMKTGITMTSAAIITFAILFIVSYIAFIPTYLEISGVVLAGLLADIFTTWFGNTPMVLAYKMRKELR
jgi:preprotein translocase subunit SecF